MSDPGGSTCVVARSTEPPAAPPRRADGCDPRARSPASPAARLAAAHALPQPDDARDLAASVAAFLASADGQGETGREGGTEEAALTSEDHAGERHGGGSLDPAQSWAEEEPAGHEPAAVVDLFGDRADRASVRAQLLGFYAATNQLAPADAAAGGDSVSAPLATVTEMTLRVDTELELLRRQCFAERNARWDFATPDMFEISPPVEPTWAPQPANYKLALLASEISARPSGKAALASHVAASTVAPPMLDGFPVGEYVRERPWPPREFAVKPVIKPKGRGGKRKATPAAVVAAAAQAPVSLYPRMCVDCRTQSTPLWRKRVVKKTVAASIARPTEHAPLLAGAAFGQLGAAAMATKGGIPVVNGASTQPQVVENEVDVCMQCYLKTERRDLFERKKAEKTRKEREQRDRAAALAAAEKKRIQQQKKQQKKQQQKQQQDQLKRERAASTSASAAEVPIDATPGAAPASEATSESRMVLKFTKDELEAALEKNTVKKEKKRSHHEKKKKKKKKKRKTERLDDSDTDGMTPMPSPPQMARYEYADIAHPGPVEDLQLADDAPALRVPEHPLEIKDAGRKSSSRSSRKRDGKNKSPGGSSSKRRRSVESGAQAVTPVAAPPPATQAALSSSRSSRSATAAPVVPAAAPTPTPSRKRTRPKKESSRERELRALGQYCPVCNETYEEDDDSSFVCCDSCEMWVHTACDPSLSPEAVAALSSTDEKYICPLCAGR